MSVSVFTQSDAATQTVSQYSPIVDGDIAVMSRLATNFAPHAQTVPSMAVALDAGHFMVGSQLIEVPAQATQTISAPAAALRIDRIVIASTTGQALVVTGAESATPVPPALPAGSAPVAQVRLTPATTIITDDLITDERDFTSLGTPSGSLISVQTFATAGTFTYTPTLGTTKIIVEVVGGGGSAGGTAATSSSTGAASSGGGAGAYAKSLLTSGFSGVSVIVGAGGAAPTAGNNRGNAGGNSAFGSFITAPGGTAGYGGGAYAQATVGSGGPSAIATGGNILNSVGQSGAPGIIIGAGFLIGGNGGNSPFGGGGQGMGTAVGSAAVTAGAGGGGTGAIAGNAARSGGAGAAGAVIVYEYA